MDRRKAIYMIIGHNHLSLFSSKTSRKNIRNQMMDLRGGKEIGMSGEKEMNNQRWEERG